MEKKQPAAPMTAVIPDDARRLATSSRFVTVSTLDEKGMPETRIMFSLRRGRDAKKPVFAGLGSDFATLLGTNTSSAP